MSASEAQTSRIESELSDPLGALGLDLEAVEITPAGKRRVLRVAVDKDGGVTMDDVAEAARAINAVLDGSDSMGQRPYTLEVTSRGVDRPLSLPRHWRRNADRLAKLKLADGSSFTGRIGESDDEGVSLDVSGRERRVRYDDVERALVQVEFNRKQHDLAGDTDVDPSDEDEVGEDD